MEGYDIVVLRRDVTVLPNIRVHQRNGLTPVSGKFGTIVLRRSGCGATDHTVSKRNGE